MRLAIDTSAHLCAACIYDEVNSKILASDTRDIGRGHAEILMDVISECMEKSEKAYHDLSEIAVTIGPGSFTGVRVGLATARGLGLSLNIPVCGISTLDACAFYADQENTNLPLATIIDAKRGEAYCKIDEGKPFVANYENLEASIPANAEICGSGANLFNEATNRDHKVLHNQPAAPIEVFATMDFTSNGQSPEPMYLRNADAKPQAGFVLPRAL